MAIPEKNTSREKIGWLIFIPAIASLIPFIGIPFGISALLWGISDWKIGGKKVVIIASFGFLLTIVLGFYYFSTINNLIKSPAVDKFKAGYSQTSMSFLIRYIEYYKIGHGHYPNSLNELKEGDITFKEPAFIDPVTTLWGIPTGSVGERQYFYEVSKSGDSYYLFSIGPDRTSFTQDDIYPIVLDEYKSVLGLRTKSSQSP